MPEEGSAVPGVAAAAADNSLPRDEEELTAAAEKIRQRDIEDDVSGVRNVLRRMFGSDVGPASVHPDAIVVERAVTSVMGRLSEGGRREWQAYLDDTQARRARRNQDYYDLVEGFVDGPMPMVRKLERVLNCIPPEGRFQHEDSASAEEKEHGALAFLLCATGNPLDILDRYIDYLKALRQWPEGFADAMNFLVRHRIYELKSVPRILMSLPTSDAEKMAITKWMADQAGHAAGQ